MINISQILKKLNRVEKIKGSMLITMEGMIIASEITIDIDKERLAAFCSSLGMTIFNSFNKIRVEPFTRYMVNSDKWKLCLVNIGKSYLIVVADLNIDMIMLNVELYQTQNMLKKTARLE